MKRSPVGAYQRARGALLIMIIMTAVNCLMDLIGSDMYYLVSVSVFLAYWFFSPDAFGILLPVAILVPWLLAWLLSKRRGGWMIVGLILVCLDTAVSLVFLVVFLAGGGYEALPLLIMNLVVHIVVLVVVALGVKNRRVGVMTDEELLQANTAAGAMQAQLDGQPAAAGIVPELSCAAAVMVPGPEGKLSRAIPSDGLVRFEQDEMVVGVIGFGKQMLIGSALSTPTEKARFAYPEIAEVKYANRSATSIELILRDGRHVLLNLQGKNDRDRFLLLATEHGVFLPPLES